MSTTSEQEGLNQWIVGLVLLIVLSFTAAVGAMALDAVGVPFGRYIGAAIVVVVPFLVISYWYYG